MFLPEWQSRKKLALNIKSRETDRLVRELAELTGESITDAVTKAVTERLERCRNQTEQARAKRLAAIQRIMEEARKLPILDDRPDDEILGYNEQGTWD